MADLIIVLKYILVNDFMDEKELDEVVEESKKIAKEIKNGAIGEYLKKKL